MYVDLQFFVVFATMMARPQLLAATLLVLYCELCHSNRDVNVTPNPLQGRDVPELLSPGPKSVASLRSNGNQGRLGLASRPLSIMPLV